MQQQYNIIFMVNACGEKMPPLIGIRAKNQYLGKVKKGAPLIDELTDSALLNQFMGCNVYGLESAKPLVVTYAPNDKACLTKIFMERIVDPILSAEILTLAARNTRHAIWWMVSARTLMRPRRWSR